MIRKTVQERVKTSSFDSVLYLMVVLWVASPQSMSPAFAGPLESLYCGLTTFAGCVVPFGEKIGSNAGVDAFSNCNERCILPLTHSVDVPTSPAGEPLASGLTWQCVEYARRWWMSVRGVRFGDVQTAAHIWELPSARDLKTQTDFPLVRFPNGSATPPRPGDLVVYRSEASLPRLRYGHVAVVVGADLRTGRIEIAEQNALNAKWVEPSRYARALALSVDRGRHVLTDSEFKGDFIMGWVRAK